jgi:hypothetical protein
MLLTKPELSLKELYEIDDHLWLEEMIKLLKENRLNELDIENLIEELESLSRNDKNRVKSFLELIIIHVLLLDYWEKEYEYNANHWRDEVYNFRHQLNNLLTTNLYHHLEENFSKIYQLSLKRVQNKTNFSLNLPQKCPYSLEQLLEEDWFPKK